MYIEKAVFEHVARFTGHIDFEQAILLLVQSMRYLESN